ncbi:hypothetical protein S140_143 [Shewanella sp. phage 1/40]|uniref:hypothetical protein n=1 Tax=Shewanella sp. phage 1/40 TaxID=1458860 RepID=UPI0004F76B3C|nr:hypothetical protein S140_143 [Shewanella sp. phage 1/40]AHK11550.1 hypothetical protein S140_143 [Shewanella sp. phage 1/40]
MKRIMEYLESTHRAIHTLTSRTTTRVQHKFVNTEWFICKVCDGEGFISDMESPSPKTTHKSCEHCNGSGKIKVTITVERC